MAADALYADLLGRTPPLAALASTPGRIARLVRGWSARRWRATYAPGKWTAAQIVLHLAHDEIAWSCRIRFMLSTSGFVIQPFEGSAWVARESPADGPAALAAFSALRRLDLNLYRATTPREAKRKVSHPEFGQISVAWILATLAGHDLHHLAQLRAIAAVTERRR